ncbi:MAG TPA: glutamine-hydrolyzing GMP synthase [Nitrososphaeraceae archaeon]
MADDKIDKIIVLDFGSQYSHLICRRIREMNVYCELLPYNTPAKVIHNIKPKGIIFSGGPASIYSSNSPIPDEQIFELGVPILGICYGHQLIIDKFGGRVKRSNYREYGSADLIIDDSSDLFDRVGSKIRCWMSHADAAEVLPEGFRALAHTQNSPSAAVVKNGMNIYGIQFHPEVVHTERGLEILKNFSHKISKARPDWSMQSFVEEAIRDIKLKVKNERVLCAVSGGIDSTTVALLLHKAIGSNLSCVFVNHGLLREDEQNQVPKLFKDHFGIDIIYLDAEEVFLTKLKGVSDPEMKRKIIGSEFANSFLQVALKDGPFQWLAQGTLYPDMIESGVSKGPASVIKTHHNVGGLPKDLNFKIIEPLRNLYKDEVRIVAKLLGVPAALLNRHPFPGPGLAVRIIGEITIEKLKIAKHASEIVEQELLRVGLYDSVWQAYAAVGDDMAVGVLGDERMYGHIVTIRVVDSTDAMTANWTRLPHDLLGDISTRITNEVEGVSWVTYAVSSKPPATIEPQ